MDLDSTILKEYGGMLISIGEEMCRIAEVADEAVAAPAPIAPPAKPCPEDAMFDVLRTTNISEWMRKWDIRYIQHLNDRLNVPVQVEKGRKLAREGHRVYLSFEDSPEKSMILDPSNPEAEVSYSG